MLYMRKDGTLQAAVLLQKNPSKSKLSVGDPRTSAESNFNPGDVYKRLDDKDGIKCHKERTSARYNADGDDIVVKPRSRNRFDESVEKVKGKNENIWHKNAKAVNSLQC